jgi:hypothetical protein
MNLSTVGFKDASWMELVQNRVYQLVLVQVVLSFWSCDYSVRKVIL